MPSDFTYMWNLEKKKEQTKQKQTHRYREHFDGCQMGGEVGRMGEKGKGLRSIDWLLQNSRGDVKRSKGDIVSHIVMTTHGVR